MPRMSKKRKHELSFYLNDRGRVTYNELCRKCQHGCKQSFRAIIVLCPRYFSKDTVFRHIKRQEKKCDSLMVNLEYTIPENRLDF